MIPSLLVALLTFAPAPGGPGPRAYLRPPAAAVPGCKTAPAGEKLVSAGLFAPESEACPVAYVGGEPVVLRELAGTVEFVHVSGGTRKAGAPRRGIDFMPPLERLVESRLIVQEAREMQLDETPDVKAEVESYRAERQRVLLQQQVSSGAKPDPAEVERLYREAVKEWKLRSVLFDKEETARAFQAELAVSKVTFDALAARWVKAGKAKGAEPAAFAPRKQMLAEVLDAVRPAKVGAVLGPVKVPSGHVVLRVEGERFPAGNKQARAEARAQALGLAQYEAVRRFYEGLVARHARVDKALLASLDLEAGGEEGFVKLLSDRRAVATIQGEAPVTVGDLATAVSMNFFHGLKGPMEAHRVNPQKQPQLEKVLGARLFAREAAARKLDRDPAYLRDVAEFERMQLFNLFVERVIVPDVKVSEAEVKADYEKRKGELSSPAMYKLDTVAFATAAEAQRALEKLRAGTDFAWFRSNAQGQLPPARRSFQLEGQTVPASGLPAGLARALQGAGAGQYRQYAANAHEYHVVKVVAYTPPVAQPYAEAREKIAQRLFAERLTGAIREYAAKLRSAQKVDVLITKIAM